eukprot:symbB.v1.2.002695.t1/scaffold133.1/size307370/13
MGSGLSSVTVPGNPDKPVMARDMTQGKEVLFLLKPLEANHWAVSLAIPGLEWNKTVKKVANWRAKWAVKLKRFVEEVYATEFNAKPLNREVELLLQGEDPYAAMATAQEEAAAEKDEMDVKDEGGVKMESFEPATSFTGARPGWCFKMGMRGLGYYRDPKQDIGGVKGEVKEEKKAKVKEEDEKK